MSFFYWQLEKCQAHISKKHFREKPPTISVPRPYELLLLRTKMWWSCQKYGQGSHVSEPPKGAKKGSHCKTLRRVPYLFEANPHNPQGLTTCRAQDLCFEDRYLYMIYQMCCTIYTRLDHICHDMIYNRSSMVYHQQSIIYI